MSIKANQYFRRLQLFCRAFVFIQITFLYYLAPASVSIAFDAHGNQTSQQTANTGKPVITSQPVDFLTEFNGNAGFSVNVASTTPAAYQWQFNSNNLTGATSDSYFIPGVVTNQIGSYRVVVSNNSGSVTSSPAMLLLDSKGTGMSDTWQLAHFGNLNQSAYGDYDGDGIYNIDEYNNGTDPTVREVYYWTAASGDFNDPANWNRNKTPGAGDTCIITNGTFSIAGNATIAVSNVFVTASFIAPRNADFTLNISGNWYFNGPFTLATGRQFQVSGAGGNVIVNGTATLNGAYIVVNNGAKLNFPSIVNYVQPAGMPMQWIASNNGSELDFSNLVTITGNGTPGYEMYITAQSGGVINLPKLTSITSPADYDTSANTGIQITANGNNNGIYSAVNMPLLNSFTDLAYAPDSSLNAYNGATVSAPLLLAPSGIKINLNVGSNPGRFTQLDRTPFFQVNGSGTVVMASLTNITSIATIEADSGAKLSFPNVTNYVQPVGMTISWTANNNGSELDFPNLVTLAGNGTPGYEMYITAQSAGDINLPKLTTMISPADYDTSANTGIQITANGNNNGIYSALYMPLLNSFTDLAYAPDSWLNAYNGATNYAPLLLAPNGIKINLNAVSDPGRFTQLNRTPFFQVNGSGTVIMAGLTNITTIATIEADGGAKLSFPNVTNFVQPVGMSVSWTANNNGSELDFSNLVTITGNGTPGYEMYITAQSGGVINLPKLTTITSPADYDASANTGIQITANGSNNGIYSALNMPLLNSFTDLAYAPDSALQMFNGATLFLPQLSIYGTYGIRLNGVTLSTSYPALFATKPQDLFYANDGMHLRLTNLVGQGQIIIWASSNMTSWVPIFTNPSTTGSLQFTDTAATNIPNRFYKATTP